MSSPGTTPTGGSTFANGVYTPLSRFAPGVNFTRIFELSTTPSVTPPSPISGIVSLREAAHQTLVKPFLETIPDAATTTEKSQKYQAYLKVLDQKLENVNTRSERKIILNAKYQIKQLQK